MLVALVAACAPSPSTGRDLAQVLGGCSVTAVATWDNPNPNLVGFVDDQRFDDEGRLIEDRLPFFFYGNTGPALPARQPDGRILVLVGGEFETYVARLLP